MHVKRKMRAVSFDWEGEPGSSHQVLTKVSPFGDSVPWRVKINLYQTTGLLNLAYKEGLSSGSLVASAEILRREEPHVAPSSNISQTLTPESHLHTHTPTHSGPAPLNVCLLPRVCPTRLRKTRFSTCLHLPSVLEIDSLLGADAHSLEILLLHLGRVQQGEKQWGLCCSR